MLSTKITQISIFLSFEMGHFNVGGILRGQDFYNAIESHEKYEQARRKIDLVITSVLLDAGAGPQWRFFEDGKHYSRSEGLAVASYHMFRDGRFSKDQNDPLRADAECHEKLNRARSYSIFSSSR